jgi:plastocyanin
MRRFAQLALIASLLAPAAALACQWDAKKGWIHRAAATPVPAAEGRWVAIKLFRFDPSPLKVAPGTTVTWTNGDAIEHSVTAGVPDKPSGDFDSGFFNKEGSFSHNFVRPGTHAYFCRRHPSMRGSVEVAP